MRCLSLNLTRAPARERSQFAFAPSLRRKLYERLRASGGCVLLVTCHRTELYFTCPREEAEAALMEAAHAQRAEFEYFSAAEEHLFLLAAGLSSVLVGEDEILCQLRESYEEARMLGATAGADRLFQAAIACGRRVRGETKISSVSCSVATLAANAAAQFLPRGGTVTMVGGTGKFGASVLRNLTAHKGLRVFAAERSHGVPACVRGDVTPFPYAERYRFLAESDVVICATASPHTVLEGAHVAECVRAHPRKRLFLDLAMPPDVDSAVGETEGCTLVGIDELSRRVQENGKKKAACVAAAKEIVLRCLSEYAAARASGRYFDAFGVPVRGELARLRRSDPAAFTARVGEMLGEEL